MDRREEFVTLFLTNIRHTHSLIAIDSLINIQLSIISAL